jgi:hypothetical protein
MRDTKTLARRGVTPRARSDEKTIQDIVEQLMPDVIVDEVLVPAAVRHAVSTLTRLLTAEQIIGESIKRGEARFGKTGRHPDLPHPNFDAVGDLCARVAFSRIMPLSKFPATAYSAGLFRTVTRLLYKNATGRGVDLKRACDRVLNEHRADARARARPRSPQF